MMYGRRYIRLLVLVAAFCTVLLLMALRSDYPMSELIPVDSSALTNNKAFKNMIPMLLNPYKGTPDLQYKKALEFFRKHKVDLVNSLPLNKTLILDKFYKSISLTTYTDPHKWISDKSTDYEFIKQDVCRDIKFSGDFQISAQSYLEADFSMIERALAQNPQYSKIVKEAHDTFKPTIPEEKQWFRFGGSSVWLPQYDLHFMVSRVLYSPSGIPNKSFVSFLYIQLFDKNWKEVPPRKLTIPYVQNYMQNVVNADGSLTEVILDKTIAFRDVEYPSFLPIPIEYLLKTEDKKYYWGPEDPRILVRKNPLGFDEPIIVFNMKSVKLVKRVMHQYLPFSNQLQVLKKRNEPWANIEKNWTPFISFTNITDQTPSLKGKSTSEFSVTHINFIYSIDPLEILTCEIETGVCDFLQKPQKEDYDYVGPLRGGTQLVQLPFDEIIPQHVIEQFSFPKNRKIYVGWARAHLNKCGCGESMYRPNMIILVEDYNPETKKFYYKLGDVSEYFDFNAFVPAWTTPKLDDKGNLIETDENLPLCSGRNVLIPNSIAYWNVESIVKEGIAYARPFFNKIPTNEELDDKKAMKVQKIEQDRFKKRYTESNHEIYFNDYMGVTLSAADADVSIVHVKGLLNYILHLPSLYDESTVVQDDSMFQPRGHTFNNECAMDGSQLYCVAYAESHGGLTIYKDEEEEKKVEEKKVDEKKEEKN